MTQRLIRVFLALAVAFVVIGRMEAAAQHCSKLMAATAAIQPAEPAPESGAMPCHGMDEAQPAKPHHPAPHTPVTDCCDCVAAPKACAPMIEAAALSRIEPYVWAKPETAAFISVEPAPSLRPPRA
jgi:hypothetical protein